MYESFYRYMMKYRNEINNDELSLFSKAIYYDHSFPKNSNNYNEISSYLETNTSYITSMSLFDEVWEMYMNNS